MNFKPLKIVFAGTPYFASYHLKKLISSEHKIVHVITQPDKPYGRGRKIQESPVKTLAKKYNIPVSQPKNINKKKNCIELFKIKADIIIVVAYGMLIPDLLLQIFPMGGINIHASLLPKWRGASPIQWTILHGDKYTGISIIKINNKMDSGNILHQVKCKVEKLETTSSLIIKLCKIGIKAILYALKKIQNKKYKSLKQNEMEATYTKKINKKMGEINFLIPANKIERMVRAFYPWPSVYINFYNTNIKIHKVKVIKSDIEYPIGKIISINIHGIQIQTKKNIIKIEKIQLPGKNIINVSQWIQSKNNIIEKIKSKKSL
ncbi:methionyl-tRNA formyltransferase [Buchnera aphidicola]|uniref:methionyl-tRNA formyltransferase n=1 Tax=Buchnera aphidicola TaxID=9 RepID=UPI0034646AEB